MEDIPNLNALAQIRATAVLSVALPARAEKEIATAGTGNPTLTTGDAPDSICPSGWRLPSMSGERSIWKFVQTYVNFSSGYKTHGTPAFIAPLSFTFTGRYPVEDGYYANIGLYISSSIDDARYFKYLDLRNGMFYPGYRDFRGNGLSLRCLTR